jgi:hypothetical protein
MTKLLACPFCGKKVKLIQRPSKVWDIGCTNVNCFGWKCTDKKCTE